MDFKNYSNTIEMLYGPLISFQIMQTTCSLHIKHFHTLLIHKFISDCKVSQNCSLYIIHYIFIKFILVKKNRSENELFDKVFECLSKCQPS